MELAGLIVAGISALGTLVQAYYTAKNHNRSVRQGKIKAAKERAKEPLKTGVKQVSKVIEDDLLEALQRNMDSQCKKLISALESEDISEQQRENIVAESRREICRFLLLVKEHNSDILPTKRLENLWESHRCEPRNSREVV